MSPVIERKKVKEMFSNIASTYDFLNHSLSFGLDFYWRKRAVSFLCENSISSPIFLDIATGTGDVILEIFKQSKSKKNKSKTRDFGLDFAFPMLGIGKSKIAKQLLDCNFIQGDAWFLIYGWEIYQGETISIEASASYRENNVIYSPPSATISGSNFETNVPIQGDFNQIMLGFGVSF